MFKIIWKRIQKKIYLRDVKKNYIDVEVPMMSSPVQPICAVTSSYIAVNENSLAYRNTIFIPLLLLLSLGCYLLVTDFYTLWIEHEKKHVNVVEAKKIKHGGRYFLESENINDMKVYYSLNASGDMSLIQYLDFRYQDVKLPSYLGSIKPVYIELLLFLFFITGILWLVLRISRFRRRAPLYFDRDQRVVYTWLLGRAWVQRYDQLEFIANNRALVFILYAEPSGRRSGERYFSIQPSGSLLFNGNAYYQQILSAICQFMEKGMDRVWNDEWSEQKGILLRADDMPSDLYEQIDGVLAGLSSR